MTPNIVPATVDMNRKITSGARVVAASPDAIFELLADPSQHHLIDGSGTVQGARSSSNPARLSKGATFGMDMKLIVPYKISNTVSEFREFDLIEWHHFGGHRWRYELDQVEGGTRVTESFRWGDAKIPALVYELAGYPDRHRASIDQTLERMAKHFSS